MQKGGTGQSSASAALAALITGSGVLNAAGLSANDVIGVADVSVAGGGKKVTVADLFSFLNGTMSGARFALGSWTGTGLSGAAYPNTITPPFTAKYIWAFGKRRKTGGHMDPPTFYYDEYAVFLPEIMPTSYSDSYYISFYGLSQGAEVCRAKKSEDGKTLQWYYIDANRPDKQGNDANYTYYYIALG